MHSILNNLERSASVYGDRTVYIDGNKTLSFKELRKLEGVGEKVANCAVLYGLRIPTAFPVDVWIKRAVEAHYPPGFDPSVFGDAAGLAQQYIYYYIRSSNTPSGH